MKYLKICAFLNGIVKLCMILPRMVYHRRKGKNLYNKHVTLICNNCVGGVIFHDLSLRFNSPTINLDIQPKEFINFVNNLRDYICCELEEIHDASVNFPVGRLSLPNGRGDVYVNFMHYSSFNRAKEKWEERKNRINWNNIFVLLEGPSFNSELLDMCAKVEYPLSVIGPEKTEIEAAYPFYHGFKWYNNWHPGKSVDYKHTFSLKRYLDDFDYISFLNGNKNNKE